MSIKYLGLTYGAPLWAATKRGNILRALCNLTNDETGVCSPSYEYLALSAGASVRSAIAEVKALQSLGVVSIVARGGGRGGVNTYAVNLEALEAADRVVRTAKKAAGHDRDARFRLMREAIAECEALLEKGAVAALLQKGNYAASDGNYAASDQKGAVAAPNTYLDTKLDTSARESRASVARKPRCAAHRIVRPGGERRGGDEAAGATNPAHTPRTAQATVQAAAKAAQERDAVRPFGDDPPTRARFAGVLDALCGEAASPFAATAGGPSGYGRPAMQAWALGERDGVVGRRAASFVRWAAQVLDGALPPPERPADMRRLVAAGRRAEVREFWGRYLEAGDDPPGAEDVADAAPGEPAVLGDVA